MTNSIKVYKFGICNEIGPTDQSYTRPNTFKNSNMEKLRRWETLSALFVVGDAVALTLIVVIVVVIIVEIAVLDFILEVDNF